MLCGIFVGGRAERMGGQPKGLLPAPDTGEPLVVRLARLVTELGHEPVWVGDAAPYRAVLPALRVIQDRPAGVGPLGGLSGLLADANGPVLALACDMPRVSRGLLQLLAEAPFEPGHWVLALRSPLARPRAPGDTDSALWQPLCARYDAPALRTAVALAITRGVRSFQALFSELAVQELRVTESVRDELVDWDTPEDVARLR